MKRKKIGSHKIPLFCLTVECFSWVIERSNLSILKEINPEYSLEGLMLKLKCRYFGRLMWTANSLEKSLMLEKIEGRRRRGHQMMRWLDGIIDAMDRNLDKLRQMVRDREACSPQDCKELDMTGRLNNNQLIGHELCASSLILSNVSFLSLMSESHLCGVAPFSPDFNEMSQRKTWHPVSLMSPRLDHTGQKCGLEAGGMGEGWWKGKSSSCQHYFTSGCQMYGWILPCTDQFSNTSWVSYNWIQFWHPLLICGVINRFHKLKVQSHLK